MNILIDNLDIPGIYPEKITSFAVHHGAEDFQRMFAVLGLGFIDCSDMAATLQRLEKEQGERCKLTKSIVTQIVEANKGRNSPKSIVTKYRREIKERNAPKRFVTNERKESFPRAL
jgi:hypothetical protein